MERKPLQTTFVHQRIRRAVSCELCRSKKLRCDRGKPCANCRQRRKTCVYGGQADTRRARNTPHSSTQQNATALLNLNDTKHMETKPMICEDESTNLPELFTRIEILEEAVLRHAGKSISVAHLPTGSPNNSTSTTLGVCMAMTFRRIELTGYR